MSNCLTVICSRIMVPKKCNLYYAPFSSFCLVARNGEELTALCQIGIEEITKFFLHSSCHQFRSD